MLFCSTPERFRRTVRFLDRLVETPLNGSPLGRTPLTPYRVLSLIEEDSNLKRCLQSEGELAQLKAVLSEEICEMALPAMLDRGARYLVWHKLRSSDVGEADRSALFQEKFSILLDSAYLERLRTRIPAGYGFVSYPGYPLIQSADLIARFSKNPERYFEFVYPVLYELEGLRCREDGTPIPGWLSFVFVKPGKMREQVSFVREKTKEGVLAVEKVNGRLVGLGGLLASLTDGAKYLEGNVSASVTTGHSYTIANIWNIVREAAQAAGLRLEEAVVAVVGAAGSVGSGLAQICMSERVKQLILIDPRSLDETLRNVKRSTVPVTVGVLENDLGKAHIVLVATSSGKVIFDPHAFRKGAMVFDDSQPKNIAEDFMAVRDDILVFEAGAVKLPAGSNYRIHRAFGPKLKRFHWNHINLPMAGATEVPSCLAEVMIWSLLREQRRNYSVGKAAPELAVYLEAKGAKLGFRPGCLQSFGRKIIPERFETLRQVYEGELASVGDANTRVL
jgi:predicted amino acid dehydrogenase